MLSSSRWAALTNSHTSYVGFISLFRAQFPLISPNEWHLIWGTNTSTLVKLNGPSSVLLLWAWELLQPFSQLLGNVAVLAACWPPLCFSCQEWSLWGHLQGRLVFPSPYLYCYITFNLESLFGDQGSVVTSARYTNSKEQTELYFLRSCGGRGGVN